MRQAFVGVVVLAFAITANAGVQQIKLPVAVLQSAEDPVGSSVAYLVKEELRRSEGYRLSAEKDALFQIRITSLDVSCEKGSGVSTALAITVTATNVLPLQEKQPQTWLPIFISDELRTVGKNRVADVARAIVADFDSEVEAYRNSMRMPDPAH